MKSYKSTLCQSAKFPTIISSIGVLLLILAPLFCLGQVGSITGYPPFVTITGDVDTINPANLNVHLEIPVVHRAGHKLPFTYNLSYDSSVYYPSGGSWTPVMNWGWRGITEGYIGYVWATYTSFGGDNDYELSNLSYHDSSGTEHPFPGLYACSLSTQCQTSASNSTSDGSGYLMTLTGGSGAVEVQMWDRSGNYFPDPPLGYTGSSSPTDQPFFFYLPNENDAITATVISGVTTFSDTVFNSAGSNTVLTVSGTNPVNYVYAGPPLGENSTPEKVAVNYSNYNIKTNFGCTHVSEYSATNVPLVSSITIPDGSAYTFTYETNGSYYTGRVASIGLPTGGTITYQYTGGSGGINCADGTTAGLKRTTPDGTWTYTRSNPTVVTNSAVDITTTILNPSNNQTVYTFSDGLQTQLQQYSGTTTLLDTLLTCYNGSYSTCTTTAITGGVIQKDAYHTPSGTGAQTSLSETFYTPLGLITQDNEYGYGVNVGSKPTTTPIKAILSTYSPTLGTNIQDRIACIHVTAGSSPLPQNCATPISATKSLTTYSGYDSTGDVATVSRWVSGIGFGATWLSRGYTYNTNGNVATVTDVNNAQTTYSYTNCPYDTRHPLGLLSSISEPLGLSRSWTWDCNGAVETEIVDENGQPTQYGYVSEAGTPDALWRISSTTDPLNNVGWRAYGGNGSTGATAESSLSFGSSTVDVLTTMDALGRPKYVQQKQAPGGTTFDSIQNTYKFSSGVYVTTQSMPYSGTSGQAAPTGTAVTTTNYDAMGRVETVIDGGGGDVEYKYAANDISRTVRKVGPPGQTFIRQTEYDSIGRITSVCEESSTLQGVGTCNQISSQPQGYFTTYTYDSPANSVMVTQNATGSTQARTYQYDGISRLVSETNPEWGPGTATYTYDSDSTGTCPGTYKGDLVKKIDSAGNTTCYTYDALHRELSAIVLAGGPNAAATPNKCFVYDAAIDGNTVTYTKSRMAEAYTTTSACSQTQLPTTITDEAFGYSARGELTDVYQSTPNSGGYYHTTASYWANGAVNTLSGVPGLNAWTFNPDGEGRPYSTTYGSTTNWVTGTTYYPSNGSNPPNSTVSFGNGDSDVYTLDPKTGRMNGFAFTVGSTPQTLTGTPGWNANGTLGTLAIVDPFNSSNNQSCSYTYDDLERASGATCTNNSTNVWGQTFSYDAFGNISKSVPAGDTGVSFQATYSSNNNHFTLPGCNVTYDSSGNLTNDCNHTYAWDAAGNAVKIGSFSLSYDALGREVEATSTSGSTQNLYSPLGNLGRMNAQTPQAIRVPLPGGSLGELEGSTGQMTHLLHSDWLGSSRLATTYTNRSVAFDTAYAPFGELYASTGNDGDRDFTGQFSFSDSSFTDLYDFEFRKYSNVAGRFISPDPAGLGATNFGNPQSFNRYAYALNNPLSNTDPTGLDCDDTEIATSGGTVVARPADDCGGGGGGDDDDDDDNPSPPPAPTPPDPNPPDPSNPTDPNNPSDPNSPTDPNNPDNPDQPGNPTNPSDPGAPSDQGSGDCGGSGSGSSTSGTPSIIFARSNAIGMYHMGSFGNYARVRANELASDGPQSSSNGQNQCTQQQQQQQSSTCSTNPQPPCANVPQAQSSQGSWLDNHPCVIPGAIAVGADVVALFFEPAAPFALSYSIHALGCDAIM